jgi:hypothetical protein
LAKSLQELLDKMANSQYAPQESNYRDISREKQASPAHDDAPNDALSGTSPILDALAALVSKLSPEQRAALGSMLSGKRSG